MQVRMRVVHPSSASRESSEHGVFFSKVLPHVVRYQVFAVRQQKDEKIRGAAINQNGDPSQLDQSHKSHFILMSGLPLNVYI